MPGLSLLPRRLARASTKPLFISQGFSSATGALAMLIAAWAMPADQFTRFSLLILASNVSLGLVRAALLQPALMRRRIDPTAIVPLRYMLLAGAAATIVMLVVIWSLDIRDPMWVGVLATTSLIPILFDWLRYRAMSYDQRWVVALADACRFLFVLVALLLPAVRSDSLTFLVYVSASAAVPAFVLRVRLPRLRQWTPYRDYFHPATQQLLDYLFGQTLIALPLIVLGGAHETELIGGVRLAQSLLGPLNLVFAAATTDLIADGATRPELAVERALISKGRRMAWAYTQLAVAAVTTLLGVVFFAQIELSGVGRDALLMGLALVGAASITTGWAGVHVVVLGLLNRYYVVTMGRAVVSVITVSGFAVGFLVNGTNASLVAGFLALAVSTPIVFVPLVTSRYRVVLSQSELVGSRG